MGTIDARNHEVYLDDKVVRGYLTMSNLFPSEVVILEYLKNYIKEGNKILDIGIGAGRTTAHLAGLSSAYVGIDYSQKMIQTAKMRFPERALQVGDVRDLKQFGSDTFDLVFFSFNGLDYISHEDRLRGLQEMKRVLKPKGFFVFSAHNFNYKRFDTFRMGYGGDPVRYVWHWLQAALSRVKNFKNHIYHDDYAIITDPGHNYRLLTYYISAPRQIQQLRSVGFLEEVTVYDMDGKIVSDSENSSWLYYLTRKG